MKPLSNCNFQIGFGTIFHRCYVQLVKENQNIQIQNKLVQPFIFGVQIIDQSFQFSESTQVIAFEEIFVSKKLTYLLVSSCAVHVSTSTWLQEPPQNLEIAWKTSNMVGIWDQYCETFKIGNDSIEKEAQKMNDYSYSTL